MTNDPIVSSLPAKNLGIDPVLNWTRNDCEQRFGFKGGRFTDTNYNFTLILALGLTVISFACFFYIPELISSPTFKEISEKFTQRGVTTYPILFFSYWGFIIVYLKNRKLKFQRKVLNLAAVPQEPDFFINPATARNVIERLETLVDDYRHFILFNRIHTAISNLNNIGQVSDVNSILRTQSNIDEDQVASSYSLVNSFIWVIPVFGFLGTVLGLGQAMGSFGATLKTSDMAQIRDALQSVTQGLAVAFDTTLLGLIGTIVIQLYSSVVRRNEMSFLDECNEYCQTHVVARLRLLRDVPEVSFNSEKK